MGLSFVDELIASVVEEVDALSDITLRKMAPILAQARRETAAGLSAWLRSVPDGDVRFTAQRYRNVLVQLDQALASVAELAPATFKGLQLAESRAGRLAVEHVHQELNAFAEHFKGSVAPLPWKQARQLLEGNNTLMKRFETSAARYAGDVGNDIRRELAVGMVSGESIRDLTKRLAKHGGPRGEVALQGIKGQPGAVTEYIAEGLFTKYEGWGARLARTETIHAYNVHADETIAAAHTVDQRIERMWSAAFDKRLCPICRDLDGKTATVAGDFTGGYHAPPAHPNCRCAVVAWRSDWNDDAQKSAVAAARTT